ncbi:hypothetical protein H5410_025575 [Solanum commersonii]|uniref:F-box domain-containing protein n=1 Tax=Solanum commersonii TaxID=4109 RepID=A0A9J5YTI2_SOLCO|nr:hypothetical protein H5410_025575 [Solanum commersonii]
MSVSKSWHQLISSPDFVNTHLKLNSNHRVMFSGINGNFNFSSLLPSVMDSEFSFRGKSKKLLNLPWGSSFYMKSGFGYDESRDDYKALFIDDESNLSYVKTLHDQLKGVFLINLLAKFVNGKLYWIASTSFVDINVRKIMSFDVVAETWGSLELPICGEDNSNFKLGAVGSDLSLIYTANLVATSSDVWILKHSGLHVSWTKQFTIEYPQNVGIYMGSPTTYPFSTHLRHSTKGDILLSLPGVILIFGGSTRNLEHTVDVVGCDPVEFYAKSIVNPFFWKWKLIPYLLLTNLTPTLHRLTKNTNKSCTKRLMAESTISVLPHEIIIEILLKVPPKSLLKFMCVSKSWVELISSTKFIKNHLKLTANDKEYSHHRIIFQEFACNFKIEETVLWNLTIKKSKKLPTLGAKLRNGCSYYLNYGFGFDETRDDYKVANSWRTINKFQGNFLVNSPGKFVDGKLYWALSADVDTFNMCNIISLDLADEMWRRLEIPNSYGKCSYLLALGVELIPMCGLGRIVELKYHGQRFSLSIILKTLGNLYSLHPFSLYLVISRIWMRFYFYFPHWIETVLLKFLSWYDFFFIPTSTTTDSIIPNEIITNILLRLPS